MSVSLVLVTIRVVTANNVAFTVLASGSRATPPMPPIRTIPLIPSVKLRPPALTSLMDEALLLRSIASPMAKAGMKPPVQLLMKLALPRAHLLDPRFPTNIPLAAEVIPVEELPLLVLVKWHLLLESPMNPSGAFLVPSFLNMPNAILVRLPVLLLILHPRKVNLLAQVLNMIGGA